MTTFLVQKTVYLSTTIEAKSWQEAMEKSDKLALADWGAYDEETPYVVAVDNATQMAV